jgi:hypothetical protein
MSDQVFYVGAEDENACGPDRRWQRRRVDVISAWHRPNESDAARRSAEALRVTRHCQQPADAGLAVSAADFQDALESD